MSGAQGSKEQLLRGRIEKVRRELTKIERGGREFMNTRAVQSAIAEGRTVDDLGLRDGDQLVVPRANQTNVMGTVRAAAVVVSLGVGVLTLGSKI